MRGPSHRAILFRLHNRSCVCGNRNAFKTVLIFFFRSLSLSFPLPLPRPRPFVLFGFLAFFLCPMVV